ncbi:hypothetical protein [Amorphus coralli]|uniref:hypothetical protein n=1 Tax=Amorphus coralli TaxID=340680 RepID=UPI000377973B|nr:hypothetical protein [Amorphus coralli]
MDPASQTDVRPRARRIVPILAATAILVAGTAAHAQSQITAKPLPQETCTDLAKTASEKTGISVDTVIGDAGPYMYTNVDGSACLFSGTATGLDTSLSELAGLADAFEGWTRDSSYDADAPGATSLTLRRSDDWLGISVDAEPPAGQCGDVMLSECKAPMKEWMWTFTGMAFSAPSGSGKPTL